VFFYYKALFHESKVVK